MHSICGRFKLYKEIFECYTKSCEVYPVGEEEVLKKIRGADLFDARTLDLEWGTQWDMASEDYNDILQFTEDYTGCAVDGEGIAGGEVLDPRLPAT